MSKSWWNYLFWWCPLTHSSMLYTFHHRTFYIKQQSTHQSHFYSIVSDLCIYKAPIFRPQLKIFLCLIPIKFFFCGCIKLENNKKIGFSYCTIPTLLDHLDRHSGFLFLTKHFKLLVTLLVHHVNVVYENIILQNKKKRSEISKSHPPS